ncbi:MAG: TPM domain-containing protein [Thermoguttaceae bacterium]|nr:TPM domain-containing protein [Thermoguttaceae bacterium]
MKLASTVSNLLCVVLFAAIALFSSPRANAEFKVPPLTGRVVDAGNVFTAEESAQIEAAILRLESATGGQMVVTTLPSLEGLSIEDVGIRLGDAWKIGNKGKDDGAILIIVVPERKMRLEVGRGWEGPINDARAGDVIRGLAPFFRTNKYADGAVWAVESVQQYVTGKEVERTVAVPATGDSNTDSESGGLLETILGVFCSIPLFALLFWCLWAIFVYVVIVPIWLFLYLIFALCGKQFPMIDPAALTGLGFLSGLGDGGGSSDSSSSSSSSYSSSSSSSSSSHYSGGGGSFGGGGASGGW